MFSYNNLKLLRLPFSFFLMPVFLFALSEQQPNNAMQAFLLFVVLHLLIYPSSNAYNSYMDQDEGSIGGLKNPPKAERSLLYLSTLLDVVGVAIFAFVNSEIALLILIYILASRAYSHRGVRLKKYPIIGYLTVVIFQGGFTFFLCTKAFGSNQISWLPIIASSFLIAGVYPLTQIYQHEQDKKDGVQTISMMLGYIGTFILTGIQFSIAMILLFLHYNTSQSLNYFWGLQICLLPTIAFFLYWFSLTLKNTHAANFENTMRMNAIASTSMNICFASMAVIKFIA
jgi:1,4-dihydroxy-2-naphthoate octaprenyltransferase